METARAIERLSAINGAGHRHMRSAYFSGTQLAEEEPWGWTREYAYLLTQVVLLLVDYNGNVAAKRLVMELADGLLAHHRVDANGHMRLHPSVRFSTDEDQESNLGGADSSPTQLALLAADGHVIATMPVPALRAPNDLLPKTLTVTLPALGSVAGGSVVIDPELQLREITRLNNRVQL